MSEDDAPKHRTGRPSRPPLTEEMIGEAALQIIDETGWESCTMKALARRLGVRAPSLYHYVEGQSEVIDLVRTLVVRDIHDPEIHDLPWDEAVFRFGVRYYRAFAKHPNTIQLLSTTPIRDHATLQMYEAFLQAMSAAGWPVLRAYEALLGLEHLALGFAYEWNAEELMLESARASEHGATLLSEVVKDRTNQVLITEETFFNLLRRYIDIFRHPVTRAPEDDEFRAHGVPLAASSLPLTVENESSP